MIRLLTWAAAMAVLILVAVPLVGAADEDAALFQEALAPYGQWLQHARYGLVWRPTQVDRQWRPYTNGRWVLTEDGYVFETDEPWGWATYHYGNWQHTPEEGWLWIPGRTWYPHTVTWRADDEYVGWAPVPPPDNSTDLSSYQDDFYASPDYGRSGYSMSRLPLSAWSFTRVNDFLYGWGEPYSPRYSYLSSGLLLAPIYYPIIYERTVYIYNYVTPVYAPRACYNWGPSVAYITKVKKLRPHEVQNRCRRHHLTHLRNVFPPPQVRTRNPIWRELVPASVVDGRQVGRWWTSTSHRGPALNHPRAMPLPAAALRPATPAGAPPPGGTRPTGPDRLSPSPPSAPRTAGLAGSPTLSPRPGGTSPTTMETGKRLQPPRSLHGEQPQPPDGRPRRHPSAAASVEPRPDVKPGQADPKAAPPFPVPQPQAELRRQQQAARQPHLEEQQRQAELRRRHQEEQRRQTDMLRQQQEQQRRQADMIRQQQEQQRQAVQVQQRQEEQRRQAEILRQQRVQQEAALLRQQQEQQRRQAEMIRQQQEQQRRQADMLRQQQEQQRRQADMLRHQQEQQRRQAELRQQAAQSGRSASSAPGQKRRPPWQPE